MVCACSVHALVLRDVYAVFPQRVCCILGCQIWLIFTKQSNFIDCLVMEIQPISPSSLILCVGRTILDCFFLDTRSLSQKKNPTRCRSMKALTRWFAAFPCHCPRSPVITNRKHFNTAVRCTTDLLQTCVAADIVGPYRFSRWNPFFLRYTFSITHFEAETSSYNYLFRIVLHLLLRMSLTRVVDFVDDIWSQFSGAAQSLVVGK